MGTSLDVFGNSLLEARLPVTQLPFSSRHGLFSKQEARRGNRSGTLRNTTQPRLLRRIICLFAPTTIRPKLRSPRDSAIRACNPRGGLPHSVSEKKRRKSDTLARKRRKSFQLKTLGIATGAAAHHNDFRVELVTSKPHRAISATMGCSQPANCR